MLSLAAALATLLVVGTVLALVSHLPMLGLAPRLRTPAWPLARDLGEGVPSMLCEGVSESAVDDMTENVKQYHSNDVPIQVLKKKLKGS